MTIRRPFRALALVFALLSGGLAASAHPHVFIDASFALLFDGQGRLAAIRVYWLYDEFYSLSMIEDAQLDRDGDGEPDPARLAAWAGHDVDWAAGFPGDFTLEQGGQPLALDRPVDHKAVWRDGRILTIHTRPLHKPVPVTRAAPVVARAYDPSYFVAYDTPADPVVKGRDDCTITRRKPDDSGQKELLAELSRLDMQTDSITFMQMPDVGAAFADRFEVTCGAR